LKILEQWGEEQENGPMKREECVTNVFIIIFFLNFVFARASWLVLTTFSDVGG
jgi:hypothetical protein